MAHYMSAVVYLFLTHDVINEDGSTDVSIHCHWLLLYSCLKQQPRKARWVFNASQLQNIRY